MKKNIKTIIVAAGVGSRLKKITHVPKCVVTNKSNVSVIDTIINSLNNAGLNENDILVVSGYQRKILCDHINGRTRIIHNDSYYCTNNFISLKLGFISFIDENIDCDLVVIDADTVVHDTSIIKKFFEYNTENKSHIFLTARYRNDEWYYLTDSGNKIIMVFKNITEAGTYCGTDSGHADAPKKNPATELLYTSTGITYFNHDDVCTIHKILREIHNDSTNDNYNYWDDIYFHNLSKFKLYKYDITGLTSEIDSVEDYEKFINNR